MSMSKLCCMLSGVTLIFISLSGHAGITTLDASNICSSANNNGDISVTDVQGATNCYGVFSGNLNSNDQISYNGNTYSELTKIDGTSSASSTADIGFQLTGGNSTSGTWSTNQGALDGDFLILLKASKSFAVWSFEGSDAMTYTGNWNVNLKNKGGNYADLSHISIYGTESNDTTPPLAQAIPEPSGLLLFVAGIALFVVRPTRKKSA